MKSVIRFLFFALLVTLIPDDSSAEDLPEFRPALLGRGRRSLINMINTESLMKRGQGDATVMFSCGVSSLGQGGSMEVYRCSANSELLQKEAIYRCSESEFEPAIYHHQRTPVWINGTIIFFIANGKPHLRIFLHQDEQDLKSGKDFIAPQFAIVSGNTKFQGFYYPPGAPGHEAIIAVAMDCDTFGKVSNVKVAYEYPPGMGFGAAIAGPMRDAVFVPGFRDGHPVACRFTTTVISFGTRRKIRTG